MRLSVVKKRCSASSALRGVRVDVAVRASVVGARGATCRRARSGRPARPPNREPSRAAGPLSRRRHVVQALEMLDVDGRDDLDPGREQVDHVLPALGAPRARDVRVRQLVDQRDLAARARSAASMSISSKWRPRYSRSARDELETLEHLERLLAAVGLDAADHDPVPRSRRRAPRKASRRSCRPRARRRGRSGAGPPSCAAPHPASRRSAGRFDHVPPGEGLDGLALDREASLFLSHTEMMPDAGCGRSHGLPGVLKRSAKAG